MLRGTEEMADEKKVFWYIECPLCKYLDEIHGKCCKAFVPPQCKGGVCKYFKLAVIQRR